MNAQCLNVLPGGHGGHHRDDKDVPFMCDPYAGCRGATEEADQPIDGASSASSSEELLPDDPGGGQSDQESAEDGEPQDSFIAVELNINEKDLKFLAKCYKK